MSALVPFFLTPSFLPLSFFQFQLAYSPKQKKNKKQKINVLLYCLKQLSGFLGIISFLYKKKHRQTYFVQMIGDKISSQAKTYFRLFLYKTFFYTIGSLFNYFFHKNIFYTIGALFIYVFIHLAGMFGQFVIYFKMKTNFAFLQYS